MVFMTLIEDLVEYSVHIMEVDILKEAVIGPVGKRKLLLMEVSIASLVEILIL